MIPVPIDPFTFKTGKDISPPILFSSPVLLIALIFFTAAPAWAGESIFYVSSIKDKTERWHQSDIRYVPHVPGMAAYGWCMDVSGDQARQVTVSIQVPERQMIPSEEMFVSPDGHAGLMKRTLKPVNKRICDQYEITGNDPLGPYGMTVTHDGISKTFMFQVYAPEKTDAFFNTLPRRIKDIQDRSTALKSYSFACLERGWGWDPKWSFISQQDFLLKADQFSARSGQNVIHYQACFEKLQGATNTIGQKIDMLLQELMLRISDQNSDRQIELMSKFLRNSARRFTDTIHDLYCRIIDLEKAEIVHIRQLKQDISAGRKVTIGQSPPLADQEHLILQRIRQDAAAAVEEFETAYELWPSTQALARLSNARITSALYKALEKIDRREPLSTRRKLIEFRKEFKIVCLMIFQAAEDPDIRKAYPTARDRYLAILAHMEKLDKDFEIIEKFNVEPWKQTPVSEREARERLEFIKSLLDEIMNKATSVENELMILDALFI